MGDWQEGLFGCFSDIESCLCSCFCPCVQIGKNIEAVDGDGCVLWAILYMFLPCIIGTVERGKVRQKYSIEGSVISDLFCSWCCGCCAMAQEAREIKARGGGNF
eukprot:TRINITY_DN76_c0_g1_i2.p1 TRINITY_DN76_c0_g1~~TRINITY_DN76_c0_g1_i2.p1  ORF type:complete len:104 (-),score=9.38 TRINITY_DN76_c0_g1_i2:205-516(-)